MESFVVNSVGMQPIMHTPLEPDDFFDQPAMAADLPPPNLEQLAAMGAQHEPQLNMELFYGTPLFADPYQPNSAMHAPQHMLMGMQTPLHMMGHPHMLQRNASALDSTSIDRSASGPPPHNLAPATSIDTTTPAPVKSNRGRKPLPRTSEERMLATQEKNRRAQRKFRYVCA